MEASEQESSVEAKMGHIFVESQTYDLIVYDRSELSLTISPGNVALFLLSI